LKFVVVDVIWVEMSDARELDSEAKLWDRWVVEMDRLCSSESVLVSEEREVRRE
jgi:hypothetical protein